MEVHFMMSARKSEGRMGPSMSWRRVLYQTRTPLPVGTSKKRKNLHGGEEREEAAASTT